MTVIPEWCYWRSSFFRQVQNGFRLKPCRQDEFTASFCVINREFVQLAAPKVELMV